MYDFNLEKCPLCGGEAIVESLYQTTENLRATMKCTSCGLTLNWEEETHKRVSRGGREIVERTGLSFIEAWNRRASCDNCEHKKMADIVVDLNSCNDCGIERSCSCKPKVGEMARINCPLWRPMEESV